MCIFSVNYVYISVVIVVCCIVKRLEMFIHIMRYINVVYYYYYYTPVEFILCLQNDIVILINLLKELPIMKLCEYS